MTEYEPELLLEGHGLSAYSRASSRRRTAVERVMPITPLLAGRPFDQESIDAMSVAFADVCAKLGLADRSDPATLMVAEKVIELAQRGVSDVDTLRRMALLEFEVVE